MNDAWIADRMRQIEASGIRKAFDMAKAMIDPINLSIGLPDFDVPDPVKAAAIEAIERGQNAYTVTQGIPELRGRIQAAVDDAFRHADRQVLITSGTSGAPAAGALQRGQPRRRGHPLRPLLRDVRQPGRAGRRDVRCSSTRTPTSGSTPGGSRPLITPRTKCVLVNSPANPTGVVASADEMRSLAELCRRRGVLLISDEVYRSFCYDRPFATPASWNDEVLVVDGFSKSHGMTGWRLGFAHGPVRLIQEMAKLQQFSFVCAPSIVQHAGVAALDVDLTAAGRRLPPQARCGRGRPRRGLRPLLSRGRLLRLPACPLGDRHRVRRRGHPPQPPDHPRQRLQPPRHPLPDLLRRRRRHPGPRARRPLRIGRESLANGPLRGDSASTLEPREGRQ